MDGHRLPAVLGSDSTNQSNNGEWKEMDAIFWVATSSLRRLWECGRGFGRGASPITCLRGQAAACIDWVITAASLAFPANQQTALAPHQNCSTISSSCFNPIVACFRMGLDEEITEFQMEMPPVNMRSSISISHHITHNSVENNQEIAINTPAKPSSNEIHNNKNKKKLRKQRPLPSVNSSSTLPLPVIESSHSDYADPRDYYDNEDEDEGFEKINMEDIKEDENISS